MKDADFIGSGWAFPFRVDGRGRIAVSRGAARVQDAIWIIVKTSLGERIMRPTFGAAVNDYLFQPNSPTVRQKLADAIRQALLQWEPRIDLDQVRVDPVDDPDGLDSQVLVSIDYRLRTTNELFNVVYPLFLEEGAR